MTVITTKGSWFDDPTSASGINHKPAISLSDPGVAGGLNLGPGIGTASLKGWFLVKDPGAKLHIYQQIDLGPAGFTRRGVDYTREALAHNAGGDPTDKESSLVYLGKTTVDVARNLNSALAQLGHGGVSNPGQVAQQAISQGFLDLAGKGGANNPTTTAGTTGTASGSASSSSGSPPEWLKFTLDVAFIALGGLFVWRGSKRTLGSGARA